MLSERTKDLSNLSDEKLIAIQEKLGNNLAIILKEANEKANNLLNSFGVVVKIGYVLNEKIKEKE